MARLTKIPKIALENHSESCTDRISNLPDSILHHILSFLTTQQAARTSVLSKQWQHLWTCAPNLDLYIGYREENHARFEQMALQILRSGRAYRYEKVRLHSDCYTDDFPSLSSLLSTVAWNGLKELHFHTGHARFHLPPTILYCENLVVLELSGPFTIDLASRAQLPSLKYLQLSGVVVEDKDTVPNLISGCPVLEGFVSIECYEREGGAVVSAPTLKRIVLDATNTMNQIALVNMDNLVEADLNLVDLYDLDELDDDYGECLTVLPSVRHVKSLTMVSDTMWTFRNTRSWGKFPEFHNVVELKLTGLFSVCTLFSDFLHKFPLLKHLTFKKNYDSDRREKLGIVGKPPCWAPPQKVPNCLSLHLLTFTVHEFDDSDDDIEFTRYILKNSKALRNVTITPFRGLGMKKKFCLVQKLLKLGRASSCCQLDFVPRKPFARENHTGHQAAAMAASIDLEGFERITAKVNETLEQITEMQLEIFRTKIARKELALQMSDKPMQVQLLKQYGKLMFRSNCTARQDAHWQKSVAYIEKQLGMN